MNVLVDTSALFALADASDQNHLLATQTWDTLTRQTSTLLSTNYIILETVSLLQRCLGMAAVRDFQVSIVPLIQLIWIDETLHRSGTNAMLAANRRQLSLVDCTSFAAARQFNVETIFAFDQHFVEQGFRLAQTSF